MATLSNSFQSNLFGAKYDDLSRPHCKYGLVRETLQKWPNTRLKRFIRKHWVTSCAFWRTGSPTDKGKWPEFGFVNLSTVSRSILIVLWKFSTFHTRRTWSMRRAQHCFQPRVPPGYRIVALSFRALQSCIHIPIWIVCPCMSWIWETPHVSSMMQGQSTKPLSFTAILGNIRRSFREDSPDPCLWSHSIYNVLLRASDQHMCYHQEKPAQPVFA